MAKISKGDLMRKHGPIPRKDGAGCLTQDVYIGKFECDCWREHGDQNSVAKRYDYPVWDHFVTWRMPRGYRLELINNVVTAIHGKINNHQIIFNQSDKRITLKRNAVSKEVFY